jgi:hypothetical protein
VELHLAYDSGSLSKWKNRLSFRFREFFWFLWWKESFEGAGGPIFSNLQFFTFCLTLTFYQPYESMTGPIVQRVLTQLIN